MWILFTNWGRIGERGYYHSEGQYQNTPFKTAEEAVAEFEKIFKAKSGNDWMDLPHFENKPKRYRLVKPDYLKHVARSQIRFDLAQDECECQLAPETRSMIQDIATVSIYEKQYKKIGMDDSAVPFGRIKREDVEKANALLDELRPLSQRKNELENERYSTTNMEEVNQKIFEVAQNIADLSSEYYYLMPKKGFSFTKLPPLDNEYALNDEKSRCLHVLELEVAERLILAARLRRLEINPLDYMYRALGANVRPLDPENDASDFNVSNLILQYAYNSAESGIQIESMYEVHLRADQDKPRSDQATLLWHGTKTMNLLSILANGLMINAPYAGLTGRMFGDGLYFADTFDKSFGYTSRHHNRVKYQYMLLCEVALGKTQVRDNRSFGHDNARGYDSVSAVGQKIPDPTMNVKVREIGSNVTVPLGKVMENGTGRGVHYYPEYCVFKEENIRIRYILKIK